MGEIIQICKILENDLAEIWFSHGRREGGDKIADRLSENVICAIFVAFQKIYVEDT